MGTRICSQVGPVVTSKVLEPYVVEQGRAVTHSSLMVGGEFPCGGRLSEQHEHLLIRTGVLDGRGIR